MSLPAEIETAVPKSRPKWQRARVVTHEDGIPVAKGPIQGKPPLGTLIWLEGPPTVGVYDNGVEARVFMTNQERLGRRIVMPVATVELLSGPDDFADHVDPEPWPWG